MTDDSDALAYIGRAAAHVDGEKAAGVVAPQPEADPALRAARHRLHEAAAVAHVGTDIPPDARLKPVKQALLAAVRPVTSHQRPFNEQILAAISGLADSVGASVRDVELQKQHTTRIQAGVATFDLTLDELVEDVRQLSARTAGLADAVNDLRSEVAEGIAAQSQQIGAVRSELATIRSKQNLVFRTARAALAAGGLEVDQLTELSRELTKGYEELYEDLEDTFRGTREAVQAKVAPYIDDVRSVMGRGPVVDVGCGRGEWLELLRDAEIEAYGVDSNEVVVERCVARGLDARFGDALANLRGLPEGSVRAVTTFHVAEHLSLDTLVGLVDAALVALKPGGLLIVETPNPTNLIVGAASFYLDPTHLKPLHPQFLQFLVEARGFAETEVRYLNAEDAPRLAPDDLAPTDDAARTQLLVDRINWSLSGPLDYAVVARKASTVSA